MHEAKEVSSGNSPQRIVARAAELLFTSAPSSLLSRAAGAAKATARSWRRGHRRAPLLVLRLLRAELQRRGAECFSALRELDNLIAKREGEPPPTSLFAFNVDSEGPRDVAYVG